MAVSLVELFAHGNYAIHRILDTVLWRYKADTGNRCPMAICSLRHFVGFVSVVFVAITSNVTDLFRSKRIALCQNVRLINQSVLVE